jgi:general stress protein 26
MNPQDEDAALEKVFDLVKSIQVAQMVTVAVEGKLRSRPMVAVQERFASELWFFTSAASAKIGDLEANREVLLTYSAPSKQNYVSVEARSRQSAETVERAQRGRCRRSSGALAGCSAARVRRARA